MSDEATVPLADIALQAPWLNTARAAIVSSERADRLPHALLIQGIPGLGKVALGEWIARYVLCDGPTDADACGRCPSCELFRAGTHPDLVRVGLEEDKKQIAVDTVRELIASFSLKSYRGRRKVAFVQPADALNTNGANALLKTLEEPSGQGLLILVATRPERLPATIASRCQRIKIAVPDVQTATAWLEASAGARDWQLPLALAAGAPFAARDLASVPEVADEMAEVPQRLQRPDADIPGLAERCQKHYPLERLRCLEHWASERIRYGLTSPAPASTNSAQPGLSSDGRRRHIQGLYTVLDELRRARLALTASNAAPALVFEQVFVLIAREMDALRAASRRA